MKKWIIIFSVSHLVVAGLCLFLGYRAAQPHREDIANVKIEPQKIVWVHRPADPNEMTIAEIRAAWQRLHDNPPVTVWTVKDMTAKETTVELTTTWGDSSWKQTAGIPVGQQGNFKFYAGLTLGTLATAGTIYGGVKLYNEIKKALK